MLSLCLYFKVHKSYGSKKYFKMCRYGVCMKLEKQMKIISLSRTYYLPANEAICGIKRTKSEFKLDIPFAEARFGIARKYRREAIKSF
jgi:hypothetical protein